MEPSGTACLTKLGALVQRHRYLLLTITAASIAAINAAQRLHELPPSDSLGSAVKLLTVELMRSRLSAVIMLHFFLVTLYQTFLLLARSALGALRPVELQRTKETLVFFVLLRCQLLVSIMGTITSGQTVELGLFVVWLAALAVLRALLALTFARFEQVAARPMTTFRDLQRLGAVLCSIAVLNWGLAAASSRLVIFPEKIAYVPWFEASLLLLRTLEIAVQVAFHSVEVGADSVTENEDLGLRYWENSEWHLLLLQTILCGCYLVQLVLYYVYVISVDQFRVSLFDLFLILNVKNAAVQLLQKVKYVKLYYQVVMDLDYLFPDASPSELESVADDVCAICLKSMSTQAKKLRCGHLFHRLCLCQCLQKVSASDSRAGLDPWTRMANGMGIDGSLPRDTGNASNGFTSMRCPICRKQVCDGKYEEMTRVRPEERPRLPETETAESREAGHQQQQVSTTDTVPGGTQEQATADTSNGAPEEVLRFSTAFLSRWLPLPNFSFEIVRHPTQRNFEATPEMLQQIWDVFPQYTPEEIRADLTRSRSVERTMERILNGRLDEQRTIDRANMNASGILGDAVIDHPSENFWWSFSTLASAVWGANLSTTPAPTPAPVEAVAAIARGEVDTGHPNVPAGDGLHPHRMEAEPLLRQFQRWRGRRVE